MTIDFDRAASGHARHRAGFPGTFSSACLPTAWCRRATSCWIRAPKKSPADWRRAAARRPHWITRLCCRQELPNSIARQWPVSGLAEGRRRSRLHRPGQVLARSRPDLQPHRPARTHPRQSRYRCGPGQGQATALRERAGRDAGCPSCGTLPHRRLWALGALAPGLPERGMTALQPSAITRKTPMPAITSVAAQPIMPSAKPGPRLPASCR